MRVCVAGAYGAFGLKHLDAIAAIDGVRVTSVMGRNEDKIRALANVRNIPHATTDLAESLARDDVDAVILSTPTELHADQASQVHALEGPHHPDLGIAMDMNVLLKVPTGALFTLSLSFNNDGPFGTFFRYICDNGTYVASYDDLEDGNGNKIDLSDIGVSLNGIELEDREFFAAIAEGREPNASVAQILPAMATLDRIEKCF